MGSSCEGAPRPRLAACLAAGGVPLSGQPPAGRGPGGTDEGHLCLARGCPHRIRGPFCRDCWPRLPCDLRAWVWRSWHSGRRAGSREHLNAMQAAIEVSGAIRAALDAVNAARAQREAA